MSITINAKGTNTASFVVGKNGTTITQGGVISPPAATDLIIDIDQGQSLVVGVGNPGPALITSTADQDLHINPSADGGRHLLLNSARWPATTGSANQVLTTSGSSGILSWTTLAATGTVTDVSVASANGFAGTSSGGATPALTLTTSVTGVLKGNGTAISAASTSDITTALGYTPVNLAGDTMTGNLILIGGYIAISNSIPQIYLSQTAAGNGGYVWLRTINSPRWVYGMTAEAESGSNVGTNFFVQRYDDSGTYLGTGLLIDRASGLVTTNALTSSGTITATTNLYVKNGANNLIMQHDGTNAYIRPLNTGSTLFLGAEATNTVSINTTGATIFGSLNISGTTSPLLLQSSAGTAGHVLTSAGTGTTPTWSAPAAGAAGTLTGTTLAANVVSSSLTSVGTLGSLAVTGNITAADPTLSAQVATKNYVDTQVTSAASGLTIVVVSSTTQTAVTGVMYVMTNAGGVSTVTLPASPALGHTVAISNWTGRTDLIVARNGSNIMNLAENFIIDVTSVTVTFRYTNSTIGWITV